MLLLWQNLRLKGQHHLLGRLQGYQQQLMHQQQHGTSKQQQCIGLELLRGQLQHQQQQQAL